MGLDMYLKAKIYVSDYRYQEGKEKRKFDAILKAAGIDRSLVPEESPGLYVEVTVGYWRKANAIHNWFVQNVQGGVDECQTSYVSPEAAKKLLELCLVVRSIARTGKGMENNGQLITRGPGGTLNVEHIREPGLVVENATEMKDLLPTVSGFFFGSTDYDEYYLQDCERTVKRLDLILAAIPENEYKYSFVYHSSW